jgi:hypothetical protein
MVFVGYPLSLDKVSTKYDALLSGWACYPIPNEEAQIQSCCTREIAVPWNILGRFATFENEA